MRRFLRPCLTVGDDICFHSDASHRYGGADRTYSRWSATLDHYVILVGVS